MPSSPNYEFMKLQRVQRVKQSAPPPAQKLGEDMVAFFKQCVEKRQSKFGKIAEVWAGLVPVMLSEHCSLESYHRGSLTVVVDSSSHLYELKQLLLAGLEKQIFLSCKSAGLRKIILKQGRWYDGQSEKRVKF